MDADEIMELLGLEPLPGEGGFFAETWRSPLTVSPAQGGGAPRAASTAIYYLLTASTCSAMHRLPCDEVFHFYLGDPVELLLLAPDGVGRVVALGSELATGQRPQVVVPARVWQGARLAAGGTFALMGTTVAPGFEFPDLELGDIASLQRQWPDFADLIAARSPQEVR